MSSQSALSGLNAASRNLDVIGNNIANANTVGMKSSRAEFSDLVASATGQNSGGIGVGVAAVTQLFTQGNINVTGRDLDIAINGGGFFKLTKPDGTMAYSRDGQFKLDTLGNIVTNSGAKLMGYPTTIDGKATSTMAVPLHLLTNAPIAAKQTTSVSAEANLDARAPFAVGVPGVAAVVGPPAVAAIPAIPATPRATYGTSLTAYDSQGVAAPVNLYFSKIAPAIAGTNEWAVYDSLTGPTVGSLVFNANGQLSSSSMAALTVTPAAPSIVPAFPVTLDLSKVTQYGAAFAVSNLVQDGYPPGELVGVKTGASGIITASYSNGQTQASGQIALADFRNVQGLNPTGGGAWVETFASGQPVEGAPGVGKFGSLQAGALEESNVDLTAELVNMMSAQRAYQANAQTIKTQDQVMQSVMNLR